MGFWFFYNQYKAFSCEHLHFKYKDDFDPLIDWIVMSIKKQVLQPMNFSMLIERSFIS